jgi:hypothetical protein
MGLMEPPSAATWMLKHLVPGERNEAMAGDLLEEFRHGRSGNWYWRQVLAAIAIGCYRDVINHRMVLAYAALWSILAPVWFVVRDRMWNESSITGLIYRMDWPWSTICALSISLATAVAFIWSGMLLYLVPHMLITRSFTVRRLGRSLFLMLAVYTALSAVLFGLSLLLPPGPVLDRRTLTPLNAITNLKIWSGCLPPTLTLLYGLWGATSRRKSEYTKTAAQS